ncbi:alpha/beta hydrolase family protein, partial [Rhizobium leguminosarum]|uniref:alpha/beta hydrolase family protein n=1 Tax=Rhizobium leguminosarum TaxID=384 RepID=UPI003F9773AB
PVSTALAATVNYKTLSAGVGGVTIPIYLYKPDGKGPFPLIVLSHGSPRLPGGRLSSDSCNQALRARKMSSANISTPANRT